MPSQPTRADAAAKTKSRTITVSVNEKPVALKNEEVTGREIKQAAIDQGVAIEIDFILVEERPNGRTKVIGDNDTVKVTNKSRFSANAGDDNS